MRLAGDTQTRLATRLALGGEAPPIPREETIQT